MYFGADGMPQNTAATLDVSKMREIKNIILGKYAIKRCVQDKSAIWEKCKKAIGQKCKKLALSHHYTVDPRLSEPPWAERKILGSDK